jgi:cytochrome b6-f complex iron-sulfur subunit
MPDTPGEGRRNFLSYFLGAGTLAFISAVAYPVLKYLTPPAVADGGASESVDAGKADQFRNNSGRIVKFGSLPALLVREENGDFKAFIAVCSHLGCTVQYLPGDRVIWCACHNGKYNLNGINISGPPPHPLTPLKGNVRGDEVVISREA